MPIVIYELPDKTTREVDIPVGQTVMDGSVRNNLPGITAECGGSCSCGTCHVHVLSGGASFDDVTSEEADLLEFMEDVRANSRLACQLVVNEGLAEVRVAPASTDGL